MAVVAHFGDVFLEPLPPGLGGTSFFLKGLGAIRLGDPALRGLFDRFVAGYADPSLGRRVLPLASLLRLIATDGDIGHKASSTDSMATAKVVSPIDEVLGIIHVESGEALLRFEVAARVGLSPVALARLMCKATGNTFTEHVRGTRIAEAFRSLAESDESVTRIADYDER